MASGVPPRSGPPRDAPEPAGDGVVWHSTCGYAECVEPSRYAADSTCKGCRRIKYCTRECQKADWKRHKAACKAAEAADEAAAHEGAHVARPRVRPPPPKPELLHKAAYEGNVKHVEALLRLGADVNAPDSNGAPALHAASFAGHAAVVSVLLSAPGVAVNAVEKNGFTALHAASQMGHTAVVRALLSAPNIDVNDADVDGVTPLYIASQNGHAAVVTALLAAPGVAVNAARSIDGYTPLISMGHAAAVSALLAHPTVSVSPRTTQEWRGIPAGATPLRLARVTGRRDIAALFKACGGVV